MVSAKAWETARVPAEIRNEPPQPTAFGKYTLLERISHGGMAEVFRAKTQGTAGFERVVAIKLLLPQVANDMDFVTMLIDEAKIAGQLSHANIAQIFDLGKVDGRYYIVQEYVPGRDLRAILRYLEDHRQRLAVALSCHIILKICEALDYAHNKNDTSGQPLNLVHRDISPQNVIVSHEGEVKLIDFGIVKAEGRVTRTLAGLIKGKFAYMSPEQIQGLPVDRRADVFAVGVILHELLTGRPLFKRGNEFETLQRARSADIEPPSLVNPDVPPELDRITLKALARPLDDRYQSAVALSDELWQVVRQSGNYQSRDQLAAWMRKTFGEPRVADGEAASSAAAFIALSPGTGRPPYRDEEDGGENMTVVDPDLHSRIQRAGAGPAPGQTAEAAQSHPARTAFGADERAHPSGSQHTLPLALPGRGRPAPVRKSGKSATGRGPEPPRDDDVTSQDETSPRSSQARPGASDEPAPVPSAPWLEPPSPWRDAHAPASERTRVPLSVGGRADTAAGSPLSYQLTGESAFQPPRPPPGSLPAEMKPGPAFPHETLRDLRGSSDRYFIAAAIAILFVAVTISVLLAVTGT